ncbi:MAG TPA: hypothetical protein DCE42_18645 [Myxococcales bacterium]|nr:hypothetical protein [Myxococcales bacterium]
MVRWSWPSLHMSREHSDSNTRLFSSIKRPDKQMVIESKGLSLWGVFLGALCLLLVSRFLLVRFLPLRRDMIVFPSELEHPLKYGYIRRGCMSKTLCSQCLRAAEAGSWTKERHTQATQDQRIDTLPAIYDELTACLQKDILPLVASLYRFPAEQLGIKEAFIVKYDEHVQCKLDLHRDASILTCSVALNDRADYVGGGTYFPSIEEVITLERAGDMLVHCGKIQHGGYPVKKGVRYLLVCFVVCAAVDILDHREIATWNSAEPSDREVMKRLFLR